MLNTSIQNNSTCDECHGDIKQIKEIYCKTCYEELLHENLLLKKEIETLKKSLSRLDKFDMCEM